MDVVQEIVVVPTKKIKPYDRNARLNDATVEKLVEIIPRVGFNVPLLLDRKNVIVKGHARWKAAMKLGMKELPCVYTDADEETIKLDRLSDNRVQEFSEWDEELLKGELASLNLSFGVDLAGLNFTLPDAPTALAGAEQTPITEKDVQTTFSNPKNEFREVTCKHCGNTIFIKRKAAWPRITMITCDDVEQPIPFVVERVRVDLRRLKVSADRREPKSTPVYFKSRFLTLDDELRKGQVEIEGALLATGLFESNQSDPPWDKVQPALRAVLAKL